MHIHTKPLPPKNFSTHYQHSEKTNNNNTVKLCVIIKLILCCRKKKKKKHGPNHSGLTKKILLDADFNWMDLGWVQESTLLISSQTMLILLIQRPHTEEQVFRSFSPNGCWSWGEERKKELSILERKRNVATILHRECNNPPSGLNSVVLVAKWTLIKTFNKSKIFPSAFKHYASGSKRILGRYHLLEGTGSYMDFGCIIYNINTTKQDLNNITPYENGPARNHSIFLNWTGIRNNSPQMSELSP